MSPETGDRYTTLLRKAIRSLPDEDQDFVLEHLLKGAGTPGGAGRKEFRTEIRKVRKRGEGGDIEVDETLEPVMIRLKHRQPGHEGGEAHREVFVERIKGPLTQMVPMRLSEDQYSRFKKWCEDHDSSMAEIVRTLIERFLEEPTA